MTLKIDYTIGAIAVSILPKNMAADMLQILRQGQKCVAETLLVIHTYCHCLGVGGGDVGGRV